MATLFDSLKIGDMTIPNRVIMAPLTRCRAGKDDVPVAVNGVYYSQRASAGLIVTEATNISPRSCAFEHAPGICSEDQSEGVRDVGKSALESGGRLFLQLWRWGRVGADGMLKGQQPLGPSGMNQDLNPLQLYGLLANGNDVRTAAAHSRAMTSQ